MEQGDEEAGSSASAQVGPGTGSRRRWLAGPGTGSRRRWLAGSMFNVYFWMIGFEPIMPRVQLVGQPIN